MRNTSPIDDERLIQALERLSRHANLAAQVYQRLFERTDQGPLRQCFALMRDEYRHWEHRLAMCLCALHARSKRTLALERWCWSLLLCACPPPWAVAWIERRAQNCLDEFLDAYLAWRAARMVTSPSLLPDVVVLPPMRHIGVRARMRDMRGCSCERGLTPRRKDDEPQ
jgi:hypothetical protein